MNQPLRVRPSTEPTIRPKPSTEPMLDPAEVAAALGAVPAGVTLPPGGSPVTRFAARRETYLRLTGGTVQVGREQWAELDALAAAVARPGTAASPERVAGVLLAWALEKVKGGELPDALRPPAVTG